MPRESPFDFFFVVSNQSFTGNLSKGVSLSVKSLCSTTASIDLRDRVDRRRTQADAMEMPSNRLLNGDNFLDSNIASSAEGMSAVE